MCIRVCRRVCERFRGRKLVGQKKRAGRPESLESDVAFDSMSASAWAQGSKLTLVCAEDDDAVGRVTAEVVTRRLGLEPRNDRVLSPRVLELAHVDLEVLVRRGNLLDLAEEELLALRAGLGAVVASAECGEAAEELAHVGLVEALEEGLEVLLLVRELVREDFCERRRAMQREAGSNFRFSTLYRQICASHEVFEGGTHPGQRWSRSAARS